MAADIVHANDQPRVFLSYAKEDGSFAAQLKDQLENNGFSVYHYESDHTPCVIPETLTIELNNCEAAVLVISRDWINSKWCRDEANVLVNRANSPSGTGVVIVPVYRMPMCDENVEILKKTNAFIGPRKSLDFNGKPRVWLRNLPSLLEMLRTSVTPLPPVPTPTPTAHGRGALFVLMTLVLLVLALSFGPQAWSKFAESKRKRHFQEIQRAAQAIDDSVEHLISKHLIADPADFKGFDAEGNGEISHREPGTDRLLATDEFVGGKLSRRKLYLNEKAKVAEDTYPLDPETGKAVFKLRDHLDESGRPYLTDEYRVQTGAFIYKSAYPPGKKNDGETFQYDEPPSPPAARLQLPAWVPVPFHYP
jgi:hypothetical protein